MDIGSYNYEFMSMSFSNFISLAVAVVTIIGMWKFFEKAGEDGWKAIIPIYNRYTLCRISGCVNLFVGELITNIVSFFAFIPFSIGIFGLILVGFTGTALDALAGLGIIFLASAFVLFITSIIGFVFKILISIKLANVFGQSGWFVVGLVIIPVVFYMILGFSEKIQYIGNMGNME